MATIEERAKAIGFEIRENAGLSYHILHGYTVIERTISSSEALWWLDGAEAMHRIMSAEIAALKARVEWLEAQALQIVVEEQPHKYNPWEKITKT